MPTKEDGGHSAHSLLAWRDQTDCEPMQVKQRVRIAIIDSGYISTKRRKNGNCATLLWCFVCRGRASRNPYYSWCVERKPAIGARITGAVMWLFHARAGSRDTVSLDTVMCIKALYKYGCGEEWVVVLGGGRRWLTYPCTPRVKPIPVRNRFLLRPTSLRSHQLLSPSPDRTLRRRMRTICRGNLCRSWNVIGS